MIINSHSIINYSIYYSVVKYKLTIKRKIPRNIDYIEKNKIIDIQGMIFTF